MKTLKRVLFLTFFILVMGAFIFSASLKVRVTVSKANIRLKPTTQSAIVSKVPLGALLDVIKKEGNWYLVKLPVSEKGIVVTGYIHQTIIEVLEETEEPVEFKKKAIIPKKKLQKVIPGSIEPEKEILKDHGSLKWREEYRKAEKQYKNAKKYVYIGQAGFGAGILLSLISSFSGAGKEVDPYEPVSKSLTGIFIAGGVMAVGVGVWMYGRGRRKAAKEKMDLLMNEGKIKGYIRAYINPREKRYAVTFVIAF